MCSVATSARQACILCSAMLRGGAALQLFGRNVLDVRGDVPDVPERVFHATSAVAVELILDGSRQLRACLHCSIDQRIYVLDVDEETDWRAAERLRAARTNLRVLVCEHDVRIADLDLGVTDTTALVGHAIHL